MKKSVLKSLFALMLAFVMFAAVVPAPNASASGYAWVVGCDEWITLRAKPNTQAGSLRKIPLYSSVVYHGDVGKGFSQVTYNGVTGYVLREYLDTEFEPQVYERDMKVVKCKQSITLRSQPSTKAAEIIQIPLGATVSKLYWKENSDFYLVNYEGLTGFALKSYLR